MEAADIKNTVRPKELGCTVSCAKLSFHCSGRSAYNILLSADIQYEDRQNRQNDIGENHVPVIKMFSEEIINGICHSKFPVIAKQIQRCDKIVPCPQKIQHQSCDRGGLEERKDHAVT